MSKARLLSLAFLSILVAGCDNGNLFNSKKVPSKLKVLVERQIKAEYNDRLVVYAMDFRKEGSTLTFTCPCYIAGSSDSWLNVKVEGDPFKLILLPGADYKVDVEYWASQKPTNP